MTMSAEGQPRQGLVVVGLVGRIAAGKSTAARTLAALGAEVIDADALAHEVLEEPEVRKAIAACLGNDVLAADGRIDRSAVATKVFGPGSGPAEALRSLEAVVHPRVRRRIGRRLDAVRALAAARTTPTVVVLDVPLLMQAGWVDQCDHVLMVECSASIRHARMAERGWDATARAERDAAWERRYVPPPPAKTSVVDTSGDPAYTRDQIERIWRSWLASAGRSEA
jgi:dephospho-CoA kinase